MALRPLLLGLLALTLSTTACRKSEVTSYRVPKEKDLELPVAAAAPVEAPPVTAPSGSGMAATAVPTATGQSLAWTAPTHWKAKPPAPMRKATYAIPGEGSADGELSITAFPNSVGGELANVNRWRGQLQLPPIAESEMANTVTRFERDGLKFAYVDFVSTTSPVQRMLGAWVPFAGGTWFFKLTGPDALLGKEKANFIAFLESVKPAANAP